MAYAPSAVCLNADLVPTAGQRGREDVVERLQAALEKTNRVFAGKIEMPLTLCAGNEWRGLVTSPSTGFEIDFYLRHQLFPLKIAAGLGLGEALGDYLAGMTRLSGPCIQRARQGLERARRHRGGIFLASGTSVLDAGANTISLLLQTIFETWTDKQLEAYLAYRRFGTEALAAENVGITQSALHQRLAAARAKTYEMAGEQLLWFVDNFPVALSDHVGAATGSSATG